MRTFVNKAFSYLLITSILTASSSSILNANPPPRVEDNPIEMGGASPRLGASPSHAIPGQLPADSHTISTDLENRESPSNGPLNSQDSSPHLATGTRTDEIELAALGSAKPAIAIGIKEDDEKKSRAPSPAARAPIPPELAEVVRFLEAQQLGQRPILTRNQLIAVLAMVGLFAYEVAAEANFILGGINPDNEHYWQNFDDDDIARYTVLLDWMGGNALAWMSMTVPVIAGLQGADMAKPSGYNRAAIEQKAPLRRGGRIFSVTTAAVSALIPASIYYENILYDLNSGLITDEADYS